MIVVDDASTDGESVAWATAQSDLVPVLLADNRGFSGACNAGARAARGDSILFLNNDAFARSGALETLRNALNASADIGIAGAKLLYADQTLQHAGLALLPGSVSGWWHVHKRRPADLADANVARDYLAVTGAALLIRRGLFESLRGFDEGFMNGWEDVDLCLRAWCAGFRVTYEPRAVLEHLESATLGHKRNHELNERRFVARWHDVLAGVPRYALPSVPPIALGVARGAERDPDDASALAHIRSWWNAHLGAAVTRIHPASRTARARVDIAAAFARRRPTLEISWGEAAHSKPTGPLRVAFVAPRSAAEAKRFAQLPGVIEWWTPSDQSRHALLAAGCSPDRVITVRLGAASRSPAKRTGPARIAVRQCDQELAMRLTTAFPDVEIHAMGATTQTSFAEIDVLIIRNSADRWDLMLPTALAQGCSVITTLAPDTVISNANGCLIVTETDLVCALAEKIANIHDVRAHANGVYLGARRTLDAYLATQFVSERVRALAGGTPSASNVAVDMALAQRLRMASPRLALVSA